eukprot:XP_011662860.1 PREDICTED: uncharacterized protein LOC105437674 [Strongylocentrotus purpuratus]
MGGWTFIRMYESGEYDFHADGEGAWETVSKNRKLKDKMKIDLKSVAQVKKPVARSVKPGGAAGTRRLSKQGHSNMPGRKPAPLTNWRETSKKKADTAEIQKRVVLKDVQIGRSTKNIAPVVKRETVNSSARGVVEGNNKTRKSTAAEKTKFDSFQEYNESFPDLSRGDDTGEEAATTNQSQPVQDYANVQPFYDPNGCDVTADVMQVLNAMFMNNPGIPPLRDQSALYDLEHLGLPQQQCLVGDDLIDKSGYAARGSYGASTRETDTGSCSMFPSSVTARGELKDIPHVDHFNILVDEAQPDVVDTKSTRELDQEIKVTNVPLDVNMVIQSGLEEKPTSKKIVFDEESVLDDERKHTHIGCTKELFQDKGIENVTSTKIATKRKKKLKVQKKDTDRGRMPLKIKEQGQTDVLEECPKKNNGPAQEAAEGPNKMVDDKGDLLEVPKLHISTNRTSIAPQKNLGANGCEQNVNKNSSKLENSISVDSLAIAVLLKTDSNPVFKSDNQNNNCQEAETYDDDSCLELTGLESRCNPDYFNTMTYVADQTDLKATNKTADAGKAADIGMLEGHKEGACSEATPSLEKITKTRETAKSEKVQAMIEDLQTASAENGTGVSAGAEGRGNVQKSPTTNDDGTKDNAQDDAVKIPEDTSKNGGPDEGRQEKSIEKKRKERVPTVNRKVTYGDVIEYVMKQLTELYSGKESFIPVTEIEHEPLPDELTRHLNLLRQLSYNYTPTSRPCDIETNRCRESSDSDLSDSFDDCSEDIEERNDERMRSVKKDGEQLLLRRYHEKLQVFAQLNHLHLVVSNPRLATTLEDSKLLENTEQLTSYISDLFPDLINGSAPRGESVWKNSTLGVIEKDSPRDAISTVEDRRQGNIPFLSFENGQTKEAVKNLVMTGAKPTEKEQTVQTLGPQESACMHLAGPTLQGDVDQASLDKSDVREGAEDSLKSIISSPHQKLLFL